jgi:hypothetical protein
VAALSASSSRPVVDSLGNSRSPLLTRSKRESPNRPPTAAPYPTATTTTQTATTIGARRETRRPSALTAAQCARRDHGRRRLPSSGVTDTLFEESRDDVPQADARRPLAARLRPATVSELVGQSHLTASDGPLAGLLAAGSGTSVVLYGPPGTGKTTLAMLLGQSAHAHFVELSAVNAGVAQVRSAIAEARERLRRHGTPTLLFIDEVHRFSKTQQDALLPAVENGWVTLVAATTENPSFSLVSPLLSRSLVLELELLGDDELSDTAGAGPDETRGAGTGGSRSTTRPARICAGSVPATGGGCSPCWTHPWPRWPTGRHPHRRTAVEQVAQRVALRYDRAGDQHYDVASALIKSIRGSDVDAALHYLARMAEAGEDPRFHRPPPGDLRLGGRRMADPRAPAGGRGRAGGGAHRLAGGPDRAGRRLSSPWRWRPRATRSTWPWTPRSATFARPAADACRPTCEPRHTRYPHDDPRGVLAAAVPSRRPAPMCGTTGPGTRGAEAALAATLGESAFHHPQHRPEGGR